MQPIHSAMPTTTAPRFSGKTSITDPDTVRSAVQDAFGEQEACKVNENTIAGNKLDKPKGPFDRVRSIISRLFGSHVNKGFTEFSLLRYDSPEERDNSFQAMLDDWGSITSDVQLKTDTDYRFSDYSIPEGDFDAWQAKSGKDSIVLMTQGSRGG